MTTSDFTVLVPGSCCWVQHADFGFLNWGGEHDFGVPAEFPAFGSKTDAACDCKRSSADVAGQTPLGEGAESTCDSQHHSCDERVVRTPTVEQATAAFLHGDTRHDTGAADCHPEHDFHSLRPSIRRFGVPPFTQTVCQIGHDPERDFWRLGETTFAEDGRGSERVFQSLCGATLDEDFYYYDGQHIVSQIRFRGLGCFRLMMLCRASCM